MASLKERFFKYVVVNADGCWGWSGSRHPQGYGMISNRPKYSSPRLAHRVSWELHFGDVPSGMLVLHRCDNPVCTNPAHLFIGSQQDNMDDMASKGRKVSRAKGDPRLQGANHPRAKLSAQQRLEVATATGPARVVAIRFGVCMNTVYRVRADHSKNN